MSISTDVIHGGHINMINNAAALGELTVGVLNDKVVSSYKRFPLLSCQERMKVAASIQGVSHVIEQDSMSYKKVIMDNDFITNKLNFYWLSTTYTRRSAKPSC